MAFSYTCEGMMNQGRRKVSFGTFTNGGGDTGGTIHTGLAHIDSFKFTDMKNSVHDGVDCVTMGTVAGSVDIVTDAGIDGAWEAFGG